MLVTLYKNTSNVYALQFVIALCFLLKTTHVLISAIIVATCNTTRTAITASSEVELPLLVVVSHGVEDSPVCIEI